MAEMARERATVRPVEASDAGAIAAIYNPYVAGTVISFEETPVAEAEMAGRIAAVLAVPLPWLVAEVDGRVAGYAYATVWKARPAYRFSAEITVYLGPEFAGLGIGSMLYERLLPELQARGVHTVLACIALPNAASVALHEKFGLRQAAHYAEVGFKLGRWVDVGYWQRVL